ncbi:MAG TPA: hypothetical protein VF746_09070 [Longimicrobium sp.]|jgi:hypothetical protein
MPDYAVFGGLLRSELELMGVPPAGEGRDADWRLRVVRRPPPPTAHAPEAEVGEDGYAVRLYRLTDGWRLAYADTGTYDVSAGGARIAWHPVPGALPELVQADVLGRVLALALGAAGALPLHGSAVALDGESIVLLGEKHHGKSTLAAALTAAGARLVSDDMAAVEPGPPALLRPGVAQLRLWADSAQSALGDTPATRSGGIKDTLSGLPAERVETASTRLGAIYVLAPEAADGEGEPVARVPLAPTEAALALLVHAKLGALLRGPLAAEHLRRAAQVVRQVPVYSLRVVRGLERLPRVAARVLQWHGAAAAGRPEALP